MTSPRPWLLRHASAILHIVSTSVDIVRLEVGDDRRHVVAVKLKKRIIFVKLLCRLPTGIRLFELHCFGVEVEGESAHIAEELA